MRYIDNSKLARDLPEGWLEKAKSALDYVRQIDPGDRAKEINERSDLWRNLKELLKKLSHGKCWYCESKEIRSDDAVDHFRPKNRVADEHHLGYWWLAFDWKNYRYSCTFCNSRRTGSSGTKGGKQENFPLVIPENRAADESDTSIEYPLLLDPVSPADPWLLYFREDGDVEARHEGEANVAEKRARISIEIYHLKERDLVDARMELYNRIRQFVELGMTFYSQWQSGDRQAKVAFDTTYGELARCVAPTAEFSAAAISYLKGLRHHEHPWIDSIF